MKRWINLMSALVFGAILLGMASGSGEAAPAPAGGIRHGTTIEQKHANHHRRPPARHVGHHNDHRRDIRHDRRHDHRNPHIREIHHKPHREIRHDRHRRVHHAGHGGNVRVSLAMDI